MSKTEATVITLLIILTCTVLPTILFANGQVNHRIEEKMVILAEQTRDQTQNLITSIYSNENSTSKIENINLTAQFEGNVTLYQTEGLNKLSTAQQALASSNYEQVANSSLEAMATFRQVYISLKLIIEAAGLEDNSPEINQELLDAINREIQRIDTLQTILPEEVPQEITTLLSKARSTLLQAKANLQEDKYDEAKTLYLEAKQNITQIYQYLKTQAEESNIWRLNGYCDALQQRIQERFRYGSQNGVNFTSTLDSLGYQSESQFMQALQNKIQNAKSQVTIQNAINDCLLINQMVSEMEQALNQEINQHQGPNPTNGNGGTNGNGTADGTTGGNNTSDGGSINGGYGGNGNYGKSGNGK